LLISFDELEFDDVAHKIQSTRVFFLRWCRFNIRPSVTTFFALDFANPLNYEKSSYSLPAILT
jgi:hypothetical protein